MKTTFWILNSRLPSWKRASTSCALCRMILPSIFRTKSSACRKKARSLPKNCTLAFLPGRPRRWRGIRSAPIRWIIFKPSLLTFMNCTATARSEEHTSELQSPDNLVCRLLLEKKKKLSREHITTKRHQKSENKEHKNRRE